MANTKFIVDNGLAVLGSNTEIHESAFVYKSLSVNNAVIVGGNTSVNGNLIVSGNSSLDRTYISANLTANTAGLGIGEAARPFDIHSRNLISYDNISPSANGGTLGATNKRFDLFSNSINVQTTVTFAGGNTVNNTIYTGTSVNSNNLFGLAATGGIIVKTGNGTGAVRTITSSNGISISNGSGVAGNINISPDLMSGLFANTTGTYVNATSIAVGTLPITRGGTGETTAPNALNALLPDQSGKNGLFLTTNGTVAAWGIGPTGYTGSRGATGFTGSRGNDGTSITVKPSVATFTALPNTGNTIGDARVTMDTGSLWVWEGSSWVDSGRFVGYTGSQGIQGIQGVIGYTGSRGATGFTGSKGDQGDIGYTGSRGIQGVQGIQGELGYTGSRGLTGTTGNIGAQGYTGSQGVQGVQGVIGYAGSRGNVGYTGSKGDTGASGSNGSNGATGFTGSMGAQGNLGYTGSRGATGTSGSDGTNGATGAQGYTGSRGNVGYTGSKGDTGNTGAQGYTGSRGLQGIQGVGGGTGAQGYTGSRGATGTTGTTGFTGSRGTNGTNGAQGYTGSRGADGESTVPSTTGTTLTKAMVGKCTVVTGNVTVPNGIFAAGDTVTIFNNSATPITITDSITTLRLAGTSTTGSRQMDGYGMATIWFQSSSIGIINGAGIYL